MESQYIILINNIAEGRYINDELMLDARKSGSRLILDLSDKLKKSDAQQRDRIYSALGDIATPESYELALRNIGDPDAEARGSAVISAFYLQSNEMYAGFVQRVRVESSPRVRALLVRFIANSRFIDIKQRLFDLQAVRDIGRKGKFPLPENSREKLDLYLAAEREAMMLSLAAVGDPWATQELTQKVLTNEGRKRGDWLNNFEYSKKDDELKLYSLRDLRRKEFVPMFVQLLDQRDAIKPYAIDAWMNILPHYIRSCDAAVMMLSTLLNIPRPFEPEIGDLLPAFSKRENKKIFYTQDEISDFKKKVEAVLAQEGHR